MTTYNSALVAQKQPAGTGHGPFQMTQHLHATATLPATYTAGDVIAFGYIPANAIIASVVLKAQSQLDSGAAVKFDLGVVGNTQLFKAAITTVGRAAGASVDTGNSISATGYLYKNLSGGSQQVIATVNVAPGTGISGVLEIDVEYFVEDTVGSPA